MTRIEQVLFDQGLTDDLDLLAKKITEAREESGLSQAELASRAGISLQHLRRLERGLKERNVPSAFIVARIAKVLGKPADFFLSHIRTLEDLIDEKLSEKSDLLRRLGMAPEGFDTLDLEAKKRIFSNLVQWQSEDWVKSTLQQAQRSGKDNMIGLPQAEYDYPREFEARQAIALILQRKISSRASFVDTLFAFWRPLIPERVVGHRAFKEPRTMKEKEKLLRDLGLLPIKKQPEETDD